jgi:hypothetical protein
MKKILGIIVLSLLFSGCSSLEVVNVNLDEIKKIKKEDYIIVAFESFHKSEDKHYKGVIDNYSQIENTITAYCKNKGKNTFGTSHYRDMVTYTYGNNIIATGQRFWCAKNLAEAGKLYQKFLKKPDEYLSYNQERFLKNSVKWLKNGNSGKIEDELNDLLYYSGLKPYGTQFLNPMPAKSKNIKKTKKTKSNLVRE